jgi:tetratricopeptide (TPR) repeat protein
MKKNVLILAFVCCLVMSQTVFAAVEDDLRAMMTDARGASDFGEFDQVLAFCNQAIQIKSDFPEAYALRSQAKAALEDMDGAKADAQKAIELAPGDKSIHPAYYVQAVIAFDGSAEPARALEFISKAIELTSAAPLSEYYDLRAEIYKTMGKQDLADADQAKSDEIMGGH